MNKIEKRPEGVGRKLLKIIACSVFLVFSVFQSHLAFATEGVPEIKITRDNGNTVVEIRVDGVLLKSIFPDGWSDDWSIWTSPSGKEKIKVYIDSDGKATVWVIDGTVEVISGEYTETVPEGKLTTAFPGKKPTTPTTAPTGTPTGISPLPGDEGVNDPQHSISG